MRVSKIRMVASLAVTAKRAPSEDAEIRQGPARAAEVAEDRAMLDGPLCRPERAGARTPSGRTPRARRPAGGAPVHFRLHDFEHIWDWINGELGSGEAPYAAEWLELLRAWSGEEWKYIPNVYPRPPSLDIIKAQWMEVLIEVYKPEEISDETLRRTPYMHH